MNRQIFYKKSVVKDLRGLDVNKRKEIISVIENQFLNFQYLKSKSKKLTGEFAELYRFKIGNYRVIYTFIPQGVLILRISHRKNAYL